MLHSPLWNNVKPFYATVVIIYVNEQVVGMGLNLSKFNFIPVIFFNSGFRIVKCSPRHCFCYCLCKIADGVNSGYSCLNPLYREGIPDL